MNQERPSALGRTMRLSDVLVRDATIYGLQAKTKEPVLREMLSAIVAAGKLDAKRNDEVMEALMRREKI